jgi:hypothetical protein
VVTILPRKSKSIRLLYFNHAPAADGDCITIKYRFSNAIYYKMGELKTTQRQLRVTRPESGETTLNLTVQGLFRKNDFIIAVKPDDVVITRIAQANAAARLSMRRLHTERYTDTLVSS